MTPKICCLPIDEYPQKEDVVEIIFYKDENEFDWKITRTANGLYVQYLGDKYFMDTSFGVVNKQGEYYRIINTNLIFFNVTDFDEFCKIRDNLKDGFTDDIWEYIEDCFQKRIDMNDRIWDYEKMPKNE